MLAENPDTVVLDIRTPMIRRTRIAGAVNIDFYAADWRPVTYGTSLRRRVCTARHSGPR